MDSDTGRGRTVTPNGAAMSAVLAAGIGSLAMGLLVIFNEAGIFTAPSLYGPVGGLSGRSTFAAVTWLVAWTILHARWKRRDVAAGGMLAWTLVLIALAIVMTLPPVWGMF